MKEQIIFLRKIAETSLLMAKIMKENNHIDSMKSYALEGKKACLKIKELETVMLEDITVEYKMVG